MNDGPRSDGVPIASNTVTLQFQSDEVLALIGVVSKETDSGRVSIADPDIQVAVGIPIDGGQGTGVIREVKARARGDIGEAWRLIARRTAPTCVEEDAIAFQAAKRAPFSKHLSQ